MEIAINLMREEENARVSDAAKAAAESRLLDLLLPHSFGSDERNSTREKAASAIQNRLSSTTVKSRWK